MAPYRKKTALRPAGNTGFSLLEVLVTIVILLIGLLGLAGLQARALSSQMESYQRSQALILLQDMASRINANRKNASSYVTPVPQYLGTGTSYSIPTDCTTAAAGQPRDFCEWNNALLGAAETQGVANNVGAMIGARGCIYQTLAPASGVVAIYSIVVAWQGLNNTAAPIVVTTPPSPANCGLGLYKDRSGATQEALHRVVTLPIGIADLN